MHVHGELHAEIHPEIPRIPNVGFLVDGQVFHPGDALTVPDEPVATLLLPVHAPWSKAAELIDYVRAVDADQAYAVHDGLLNDIGLGMVGRTARRAAGRARPRPTAGWPRGSRSSSEARPGPPGVGSADGAAVPAGERWTPPPTSTAATMMEMIQRIQSTPLVCATPSAPADRSSRSARRRCRTAA